MKFPYTIIFVLFVLSLYGVATPVFAQFSQILQPEISVDMQPANPGANQPVSVIIESYATDLNSAYVTWQINGKTVREGPGVKTFLFTTGDINTETILDITIKTRNGEVIEKSYTIKPSEVDLIWQTDGFVPPFFKGKALFSHQNKIKFVAVPHIIDSKGQEIPAKNLVYKWTRNGTVLGDFSGYGKNTYTLIPSIISRPLNIEVEVTSPDSSGIAYTQTTVYPIDPKIVFYKKDPLYGIQFQNAFGSNLEINDSQELTVMGYPLYFGAFDPDDYTLAYKWAINGERIANTENQFVRVFRQKEGTSGTAQISLSVENQDEILQYASSNFFLKFGTKEETTPSAF